MNTNLWSSGLSSWVNGVPLRVGKRWAGIELQVSMESKSIAPLSPVKFEVFVKHPDENVRSAGVQVGLELWGENGADIHTYCVRIQTHLRPSA